MKGVFFLVLLVLVTRAQADDVPFYASIGIELGKGQSLPLSEKIQYEIEAIDPDAVVERLGEWQGIFAKRSGSDTVSISQNTHPRFIGQVNDKYLESSFVVDFDESSVADFISGFKTVSGGEWTLERITGYVSDYIDDPTYIHGFNIASVVASNRSGDCTEYAVLTAALARALAYPARVVLGTAILNVDDSLNAYGHAWTEVWYNKKWQIVDAALHPLTGNSVFYMPGAALDNEGLGHMMGLMSAIQALPSHLRSVQSVSP